MIAIFGYFEKTSIRVFVITTAQSGYVKCLAVTVQSFGSQHPLEFTVTCYLNFFLTYKPGALKKILDRKSFPADRVLNKYAKLAL